MAKYIDIVNDFESGDGLATVECDKCGKQIEVDSCNYSQINQEAKDNGWIICKIDNEWHEFCCKECKDKFEFKEIGWDFDE